jgi:hypothetical protein
MSTQSMPMVTFEPASEKATNLIQTCVNSWWAYSFVFLGARQNSLEPAQSQRTVKRALRIFSDKSSIDCAPDRGRARTGSDSDIFRADHLPDVAFAPFAYAMYSWTYVRHTNGPKVALRAVSPSISQYCCHMNYHVIRLFSR